MDNKVAWDDAKKLVEWLAWILLATTMVLTARKVGPAWLQEAAECVKGVLVLLGIVIGRPLIQWSKDSADAGSKGGTLLAVVAGISLLAGCANVNWGKCAPSLVQLAAESAINATCVAFADPEEQSKAIAATIASTARTGMAAIANCWPTAPNGQELVKSVVVAAVNAGCEKAVK